MVGHNCCITNCHSKSHTRSGKKLSHGLRFFRFPTCKQREGKHVEEVTRRRRMAWIAATRRSDITYCNISESMRVCSLHFHSGRPAYEMLETHPDWAPSLLLGHNEVKVTDQNRFTRQLRRQKRREDCTSSYSCCVLLCTASSNITSYLSFHSFPKDKEMQKMWLDNIRRDCKITNQTRVCSRHFLGVDLVEPPTPTGRRCLKDGAVPVLFHWNNFSFTVPAPCTRDWDTNDSLMFGKYSDHDYCSTAEAAALHQSLDHIEHPYAEKTCLWNNIAESSTMHSSGICLERVPASDDDFRSTEMEIAYCSPGSDVPTQLCKSEQTEACIDSEEMMSSPLGDTTSADEPDEGLLKIIKVEECEDFGYFGEGMSSFLKQEISEEQQTKEVKEEESEYNDQCLYCEKCKSIYINKCEFHGPAVFIPDTPVPVGVTDRARLTLPLGLEVRQSDIFGAGLGVFNKGETVPVGVNFGPYEGGLVDRDIATSSGYSWVIYRSRQCNAYIDATKESYANWMRYVNCARSGEEQNLVAFQYRGGIYYCCHQPIKPGQELLVWYGELYPRDHSFEFNCLWNKKASMNKIEDSLVQVVSCSLCHLSYPSQIDLQKHIRRSHCQENNIQQTLCVSLSSVSGRAQEEVDRCTDCGGRFTHSADFQTHRCEKVHIKDKLHICSKCGKSFAFYSTLQKHQQHSHTTEKTHHCLQCGKCFTRRGHLQAHRRLHTRQKLYNCTHCGKRFNRPNHLQTRQRIHTIDKPYQCAECRSRRKNTRRTHLRTPSEEKRHVCIRCGKSFPYASRLRVHKCIRARQKPSISKQSAHCSQCRKSFRQQSPLQIHQCVHKDSNSYRCSDCRQRFQQVSMLKTHECVNTVPSVTVVV